MAFGLTIGTERATALQNSIQDELTKREYSADADPVMAEYITIMIINNKSPAQITTELEDLIGSDFDSSFTSWLFTEAAKGSSPSVSPSLPQPPSSEPSDPIAPLDSPHPVDNSRRLPNAPRTAAPIYQQAIHQAIPGNSSGPKKRAAPARSPSPGPNKSRRTDLPTGPRAMFQGNHNSRSLLERVGGPPHSSPMRNGGPPRFPRDDIQARIDNITNNPPDALSTGVFQQQNGMGDMGPMGMGMANPLLLQEMMMSNMALMAQMASSMGLLGGPPAGQFPGGPGFPMQGVMPGDVGMYPGGGMNNGFPGSSQSPVRGMNSGGRGGRGGGGRGRGGHPTPSTRVTATPEESNSIPPTAQPNIVAPTPTPAAATPPVAPNTVSGATAPSSRPGYVPPERPQSPTLCKFGPKCTNALCRFSHPSPVATAESGVVLSVEACEKGKDCKDKDCIKAHVSPAVLTAPAVVEQQPAPQNQPQPQPPPPQPVAPVIGAHNSVPCRFGIACTRPNCAFAHPGGRTIDIPHTPASNHYVQQCRFGAGCTRATCPFQHPPGRVLPSSFHRGLSTNTPMVNVPTPEAGSMRGGTGATGPSPHRSVTFNQPTPSKKDLERRVREAEERKNEAVKAVQEAEAAAAAVGKKDESKIVEITA